jgi:hypothetical protein
MTTNPQNTSLNLNGIFYSGFRAKLRDGNPVYGPEEQTCIQETVAELQSQPTTVSKPGMLLGKIQSGKTKTFLGIIALAFDNLYDLAIILTKPTTALAKQTIKRVAKEFGDFIEGDQVKVYDILEIPDRLTAFELNQKLIFVVKKQSDNLDRLANILLETYPHLSGKRILLVDDEADNASIGYQLDQSQGLKLRKIADQVEQLRLDLPNASFLQVTATPYSLYLQPEDSPIPGIELKPVRPSFTKLVPVHTEYVGGDFYFEDSRIAGHPAESIFVPVTPSELDALRSDDRRRFKIEDCLTSERVTGLRRAIVTFIVGGSIRRIQDELVQRRPKRFAFLFHTEFGRAAHSWQESVVLQFEEALSSEAQQQSALLRKLAQDAYQDLSRSILLAKQTLPAFDEVWARVVSSLVTGELNITKVNSEAQMNALLDDEGQLKLRTPLNIFIGGQILDRGVTIANLIGFYYGRDPKKFQQDTVLQHSRMYGFRPLEDRAVTRFYTARHIHRVMERMHESDTALRERIETNGDQGVMFIDLDPQGKIIPCSRDKILASTFTTLKPHRRLLPVGFQTDYKTRLESVTASIDGLLTEIRPLPRVDEAPNPFDVELERVLPILDLIDQSFEKPFEPGYEDRWDVEEYKAILRHLSDGTRNVSNRGRVFLVVRTGRNLSRLLGAGSHGTYADSPEGSARDIELTRRTAVDIPVLSLIRQNGHEDQLWRGCAFWWPVIMSPANTRTALLARRA